MSKTATVRARIEPSLKTEVDSLFKSLGITATEAITLFYTQVKLNHGLPFKVEIPNDETRKVIDDAKKGVNIVTHTSNDEAFAALGL